MPETHNGVTLNAMTYNGVTVNEWKHNGVEVYSAGVIVKYVVVASRDSGRHKCDIKRYDNATGKLISQTTINYLNTSYSDGIMQYNFGNRVSGRWTIKPLVPGTVTVSGVYNKGSDYAGGSADEIVPYLANQNCTITFITSEKIKV